ncbi:MAG: hypothetical protein Q8Q14_16000 [Gemmatimonadales bacterium]|nr:hypothetical protein [Gemmatimonadales bacterium]
MARSIAVSLVLVGAAVACDPQPPTGEPATCPANALTVTIGRDSLGPLARGIGFLHGISDPHQAPQQFPDPTLVAALAPTFWRVSDGWHVQLAEPFGVSTTFVLYDGYADYDPSVRPWDDWAAWEAWVAQVVRADSTAGGIVDWWDVWGEPNFAQDPAQVAETYKRAHDVIRSIAPAARIVAPSVVAWNEATIAGFLDYAVAQGLTINAISWHEFGQPGELSAHVTRARELVAARPFLGSLAIHINEYEPYEQHLIPSRGLAWLDAFERTGVNESHRACWDVVEGADQWSTCWNGLDGLLMKDNVRPQALYWLYHAYARMAGQRLAVDSGAGVVVLAAVENTSRTLRALVGRASPSTEPDPVDIAVTIEAPAWAGASLAYTVDGIPYTSAQLAPQALAQPVPGPRGRANVNSGTVTLQLRCVGLGEVRVLRLEP